MHHRPLGRTGLSVSVLGFGAFKIGRNQKTKYPGDYELPSDSDAERLLLGALDLGFTCIDTAPAYGISEERIGRFLAHRRHEFVLSTKVGETFEQNQSRYDFSAAAVRASLERSLRRLRTDVLDIVLIHSDGDDLRIQHQTDAVPILQDFKSRGLIRGIGLSGKSVAGAEAALDWADVLMVEYHARDTSHAQVLASAAARGLGTIVKKGLASGHLPPETAIPFVLENPHVATLVVGGSNLDHLRANAAIAETVRTGPTESLPPPPSIPTATPTISSATPHGGLR